MTTNEPDTGTDTTDVVEDQAAVEEETNSDIDALLADPSVITLSDGQRYRVERLKTRGMLRLLKVLTGGAQDVLMQTKFSADMDPQEFAGIFIGSLLFSLPEQENETVDFIKGMVLPYHFIDRPVTVAEKESNRDAILALEDLLDDPEPEDTIAILTAVFTIEAPNILSLGKRVMALLEVQRKSQTAKGLLKSPSERSRSSKPSDEN
jgi:hypothetical protein